MASTLIDARAIDTSAPACTLRKAHNSTRSMVVAGLERVLETGHLYRGRAPRLVPSPVRALLARFRDGVYRRPARRDRTRTRDIGGDARRHSRAIRRRA